jgi:arsenite methyltransferase
LFTLEVMKVMNAPHGPAKSANYGIDAPEVVKRQLLIGSSSVIIATGVYFSRALLGTNLATSLANFGWWAGGWFLLAGLAMIWGSKFWKLRLRDKIIRNIAWRGDERVLDVGCGHGLMLIAAARRLATGKAIGLDIWQKEDQAGNSPMATLENIRIEGVEDRVILNDGDARNLPFEEECFDVIVSSWALHNIYDRASRDRAILEIVRVLKPGGRLAIADIRHTSQYAALLRENGLLDVKRSWPNFLFVIPTFVLTARKPLLV